MQWNELVGFAAALAVLASFSMSSIIPLRSVAILSNVLFIIYGALGHIHPVLLLHAALLPINLIKLYQIARSRQLDCKQSEIETRKTSHPRRPQHQTPLPNNRERPFPVVANELKWF
jgi:hypothetical protein